MQQQQLSRPRPMPEPAADQVANAHVQASEDLSKDCDTELFLLGAAELEMGNLPGAAELLAQAIAINPNVAVYHAQLGRACVLLRRFDDAVTAFGRAVALDPHPANHHYQLGLALGRNGDATSAIVASATRSRSDSRSGGLWPLA